MDHIYVGGIVHQEGVAAKLGGGGDGLVLKDKRERFGLLLPMEFPAPLLRRHTAELLEEDLAEGSPCDAAGVNEAESHVVLILTGCCWVCVCCV